MDKLALLKSAFVFGGLEDSLLERISGMLKEAKFAGGAGIFSQGKAADSFFIIETGEVLITKILGPGRGKTLALLGPGSVFGEMAFFSDSPRTADAVSKTDTVLWKIERADFMKFTSEEPKAGLRVLSGLLHVAMDRLEHTSRELATICETGRIISSGKTLEGILKSVMDEVLLAIPEAAQGAAYIYNEFNDEFDPLAAPEGAVEITPSGELGSFIKLNPQGAILGRAEDIAPVAVELFKDACSLLISPIIKDRKLRGFILLWADEAPGAFKSSQLLLVATVSSQLAEAIENLRHAQDERDRQRLNNAKQSY